MATAAIAALRRTLPGAHIALAVGQWSRPAVANNPRLDSLIEAPDMPTAAGYLRLARFIRRGRFGTALVLDRSPLLNLVPFLAGVPVRAGLDSGGRGLALTHPVPCPTNKVRHEVQWYLDVARAPGIPLSVQSVHLEFYPTEHDRAEAAQVLSAVGEVGDVEAGYVAIHLGGGANPGMHLPAKRWLPERWALIADWLAETYQPTILLLGGPDEADRQAAQSFWSALFPATRPYVVDLVGRLEWPVMGALIERCNLFLGHDTGAMHLATAVRTPVVAVFGPSDPARYGPWDPSGRSIAVAPRSPSAKRAGTHITSDAEALRRAAKQDQPYHNLVSAEEVWAAVQKVYRVGEASFSRQQVLSGG
jgi:ADP-heptose:LPS heptosyltransferase